MRKHFHILLMNDLRKHLERKKCWCEPEILREGRNVVVLHRSIDGRELIENHGPN